MKSPINLVSFLCLWVFTSCNFGDTNLDPTRETDATLQEMLPAAQAQSMRNVGGIGARVTGIVIQHFKGIDAQPEGYSSYLIDGRTLDELWKTGIYAGALKDCRLIIDKAQASGNTYYEAIAKILIAFNLGVATSFWGDIPWSQALQPDVYLQPQYDRQEQIYEAIQTLLDEALVLLAESPHPDSPKEDDLIFGGDPQKWEGTAWALKARYHLHLSKKDPLAYSKVIQVYANGAFSTLEGQAKFSYGKTLNEANPLTLFSIERPNQLIMGDFLRDLLIESQDPRFSKYAVLDEDAYRIYQEGNEELYWGQLDAPVSLISLSELQFILAEAYLNLGLLAQAEQSFKQAVFSNFEELGINHLPQSVTFIRDYITFKDRDSFEDQLEFLINQKYIALYGQGIQEAWIDQRRTGYPQLTPPLQANSSFNPGLTIPRRYLYPISENNTNAENLQKAINRQGGHLLDQQLWIFQ